METSENTATPSPAPAARRRSGRQTRAPEKFQPETTIAPKRKRGAQDEEDDVENHDPEDDEEESSEDPEDSPAEEERSRPKKKPASQPSRAKKPALKKPKVNGTAPAGASMSIGLPSRPKPKKIARVVTGDARDGDGVYGEHCCTQLNMAVTAY